MMLINNILSRKNDNLPKVKPEEVAFHSRTSCRKAMSEFRHHPERCEVRGNEALHLFHNHLQLDLVLRYVGCWMLSPQRDTVVHSYIRLYC